MQASEARARIVEAAGAQAAEEGAVTYAGLMARTGIGYMSLKSTVHRMRPRGLFPWEIRPAPPSGRGDWGKRRAGPVAAVAPAEPARADEAIRRRIDAKSREDMIDARAEVDDPREHGLLAVPRSLPRADAGPSLAEECRMYYRHWRAVVKRQRWGTNERAVA